MTRAYQGYYSDYVISGTSGVAVVGATVNLFLANQFTVPPFPTGATGLTPVATATTDTTGLYVFDKLIPDDYFIQVVYTPAGGSTQYVWKYQVPIFTYEETRRTRDRGLGTPIVRTLAKLHSGQNVIICCVGDSITVGYNSSGTVSTGYVADVAAQLATMYPNATVNRLDPNSYGVTSDAAIPGWSTVVVQSGSSAQVITIVNCGVSGDTCLRVMRRFANLTANGYPDLVTIYLGVNDALNSDNTKYVDAATFQSHLAALVNQILSTIGCEILLMPLHVNDNVGHTLPALEPYADATRAVAAQFRCGFVDLRKLWLDHYDVSASNSGFGTWLDGTAGNYTHPSDVGHLIDANEIMRAFQTALDVPVGGGASPAGFSAGKTLELVRMPWESSGILSTDMVFVGAGWTAHQTFQNSGQLASTDSGGLGTEFLTSHAGDTCTIKVRCTEVYLLCRRWSDSGQISVVVDGVTIQAVLDMYRGVPASTADLGDYNGAVAPQDRVLLARGLSDTVHTVVLTALASKNGASSNYYWRFDALEVVRPRQHGYQVEGTEPLQVLQRGVVSVTLTAQSFNFATVTFARPFNIQNGVPTVVATANNVNYFAVIGTVSAAAVQIYLVRRDGTNVTDTQTCTWIAVAP